MQRDREDLIDGLIELAGGEQISRAYRSRARCRSSAEYSRLARRTVRKTARLTSQDCCPSRIWFYTYRQVAAVGLIVVDTEKRLRRVAIAHCTLGALAAHYLPLI